MGGTYHRDAPIRDAMLKLLSVVIFYEDRKTGELFLPSEAKHRDPKSLWSVGLTYGDIRTLLGEQFPQSSGKTLRWIQCMVRQGIRKFDHVTMPQHRPRESRLHDFKVQILDARGSPEKLATLVRISFPYEASVARGLRETLARYVSELKIGRPRKRDIDGFTATDRRWALARREYQHRTRVVGEGPRAVERDIISRYPEHLRQQAYRTIRGQNSRANAVIKKICP